LREFQGLSNIRFEVFQEVDVIFVRETKTYGGCVVFEIILVIYAPCYTMVPIIEKSVLISFFRSYGAPILSPILSFIEEKILWVRVSLTVS
jgi:hypothetical protein